MTDFDSLFHEELGHLLGVSWLDDQDMLIAAAAWHCAQRRRLGCSLELDCDCSQCIADGTGWPAWGNSSPRGNFPESNE